MVIVKVNKERCKSCGLCIEVCPFKVFRISKNFNKMGYHYIEPEGEEKDKCTGCRRCVIVCPDVAIELYKKETDEKSFKEAEKVSSSPEE
jgi:2-oxoglutarate ferredoxin oxidoreductase subunit delta